MKKIIFIVACLFYIGCDKHEVSCSDGNVNFVGLSQLADDKLKGIIITYYEKESGGQWSETYKYRPSEFKELVRYDLYRRKMKDSFRGWQIKRVEVINVSQLSDGVDEVTIEFLECFDRRAASEHFGGKVKSGVYTSIEKTLWRKEGKNWSVLYPGARNRIEINNTIIQY